MKLLLAFARAMHVDKYFSFADIENISVHLFVHYITYIAFGRKKKFSFQFI